MENSRSIHKERFYKTLNNLIVKPNSSRLSETKMNQLISEVKIAQSSKKKNRHYWLLKHYDVLSYNGRDHLIFPLTAENQQVRFYCSDEMLFDTLYDAHIRIAHGARDRMIRELRCWKNITQSEIKIFLDCCDTCQLRRNRSKPNIIKPTLSTYMNSRAQIDIVDFQSMPDGEFKFVLNYQDHLTKFIILKALKSKRAAEIATHVLDIFLLFGAPCILQSDNVEDFCCKDVIKELKTLWPKLNIVHGKPDPNQSQDLVKAANIRTMVATWMKDARSSKWSMGIKFAQFSKNRALHADIRSSPYRAMLGYKRMGWESINIPKNILSRYPDIMEESEFEEILKLTEAVTPNVENEDKLGFQSDDVNQSSFQNDDSDHTFLQNYDADQTSFQKKDVDQKPFQIYDVDQKPFRSNDAHQETLQNIGVQSINEEFHYVDIKEELTITVEEEQQFDNICIYCNQNSHDNIFCSKCSSSLHTACSEVDSHNNIFCHYCYPKINVDEQRKDDLVGSENHAKRMKIMSDNDFEEIVVGKTVLVPLADFDKEKGDFLKVLGVILDVTEEGYYQIGTKTGRLDRLYDRSQITLCDKSCLKIEDVPDREMALGTVSTSKGNKKELEIGRCNCKTRCISNRCYCKKSGTPCSSECHNNSVCCNKKNVNCKARKSLKNF